MDTVKMKILVHLLVVIGIIITFPLGLLTLDDWLVTKITTPASLIKVDPM